ncbi:hypothetical protein ElyMa_001301200 [Elysia marginata]|uniref:Uncharacterized protein n=1 Tax=Elysia marginata TaxID=1093978 RepID=A0AAV4IM23_9GAST|nr:hypothetical protein ElyMa_001301200 [Elysia marginata]
MAEKISKLLDSHGCQDSFTLCSARFGIDITPSCEEVRESGACIFGTCPALQGTGDDVKAAEILIDYANQFFGCNFTLSTLNSGGDGVLQTIRDQCGNS